MPLRAVPSQEAAIDVVHHVRRPPAEVRVHGAHERGEERGDHQPPEPGRHEVPDHHRIGELGVGGQRRVHGRGGEDEERAQSHHDPRPGEEHGSGEGEPERRLHRLPLVAGREQALRHVAVSLPASQPQNQNQAEEGDDLERGGVGRAGHEVEGARRRPGGLPDGVGHGRGPPETDEHDACEGRRAQHAGHELEEVGHHHPPEPRRHGVGQRQPDADGEGDGRVPAQQDLAELDHRQHDPAHDDGVLEQPLVHGGEAAQRPRGRAAVADLDDLGVGEHARPPPQARVEEGEHEDARRLVPPQPVAVHALSAHEGGGGEGRVGREPGGRHGGAGQPPGQRAAGHEVVLDAGAGAPGEPEADREHDGSVDADHDPVERRQRHVRTRLVRTQESSCRTAASSTSLVIGPSLE